MPVDIINRKHDFSELNAILNNMIAQLNVMRQAKDNPDIDEATREKIIDAGNKAIDRLADRYAEAGVDVVHTSIGEFPEFHEFLPGLIK